MQNGHILIFLEDFASEMWQVQCSDSQGRGSFSFVRLLALDMALFITLICPLWGNFVSSVSPNSKNFTFCTKNEEFKVFELFLLFRSSYSFSWQTFFQVILDVLKSYQELIMFISCFHKYFIPFSHLFHEDLVFIESPLNELIFQSDHVHVPYPH